MASTMVIKVQYNSTLRRFNALLKEDGKLDIDLNSLKAKILGLFSFPSDADLSLTYFDEDGDVVSLVDDGDLSDITKQNLKFLRINVVLNTKNGARPNSRSSGSSTFVISPHWNMTCDGNEEAWNSQLPSVLNLIPDPLRATISQVLPNLVNEIAAKASPPNQAAETIVEALAKLGVNVLNTASTSINSPARGNGGAAQDPKSSSTTQETHALKKVVVEDGLPKSDANPSAKEAMTVKEGIASQSSSAHQTMPPASAPSVDCRTQPSSSKNAAKVTLPNSSFPAVVHPHETQVSRVNSQNDPMRVFHRGVQCDGCGVCPIVGPRYKSRVRNNYDLCRICFEDLGDETEYEKIDKPRPVRHQCPMFGSFGNSHLWPPPHLSVPPPPLPHMMRRQSLKAGKSKLDSRFISDVTVLDGTVMAPSTPFTKIWRMRNNGNVVWPHGVHLVWIGGDRMCSANIIGVEVPLTGLSIDGELDIAADFTSPEQPGRYISYWRMSSPCGTRFGQRVWVLIQVDASLNVSSDGNGGLNLISPPALTKGSEVDRNVQTLVESGLIDPSGQTSNPETAFNYEPINDQSAIFPIDNVLLDPIVQMPVPPISLPMIDLSSANTKPSPPVPVTECLMDVETSLLKELEEMGFKEVNLNKEVLRTNQYNMEQSVEALCGVSDWDPLLEDLEEMGFNDKETNIKLLEKNNGSIKRVVMDLLSK